MDSPKGSPRPVIRSASALVDRALALSANDEITQPDEHAVRSVHYPAIFLSDIHLGTRDCQAEQLVAFLKQHRCDELYLVGDIIDGWQLKSGIYWPQSHNDVLRRILTLAKRGTQVYLVTGNHDEFLRRYSPADFGNLHVVDEAEHVTRDGKRLLIIHGDQYDVVTRYHRWLAVLGDHGYSMLLWLNRSLTRLQRYLGRDPWSLSAFVKRRVKTAVNFVSQFEDAVALDCQRLGYDGVVCGHIHHAEIRDLQGVRYLNCGDWVESCTALVERSDGSFSIIDWHRSPQPCVADTSPPDNLPGAQEARA